MRRGLVVVAAVLAVAAVGCGGEKGVVVEGTPPATPYAGPLHVPAKDLDEDSVRAMRVESGAAGRALECDGEIYSGGEGERWSEGDGGETPEDGLKLYFDIDQPDLPRSGYRVEREDGDRVLYSFDVGGRTKVAVVVAEDRAGAPGWGPETTASCNPAELPADFTDSLPYEIWTDEHGRRVQTTLISSSAGSAHCDWQEAHFLELGAGDDARLYARDPDGVLEPRMLTAPYDGDVTLPNDAHDTGYRFHDRKLWLTDDPSKVYVRTPDGVEAWPLVKEGMGCR
ncbi:hypothetical protein [Streptomyces griseus]|uniref:hypothetical protein n=1 Tax=Streptomyces griseus TaxID=1911 RepID=UPI00055ECAB4|nr:hypothetical protein [Streptomyces griseus]